ncbi:unnamed protein product [Schistosoma rodhaini]|uniref:Peptidase M14 domain-containing protein n=2 Tax=Schistosoma rodhaini TaxID=6188 RepID=A0AA85FS98_9TREM|nr:unnamed protein product [Schistosoma rodhaini]
MGAALVFTVNFFIVIWATFTESYYPANVSNKILHLVEPFTVPTEHRYWDLLEAPLGNSYNHYDSLFGKMQEVSRRCPMITTLYTIGKSVAGRELWVLSFGKVSNYHVPGVPEVKFVGNMHGNEAIGRELILRLAYLLCMNYGSDEFVTLLVNYTQIHLMPSANPDGFEISNEGDTSGLIGRNNLHNVDLNRNFPDQFGETNENIVQEPETKLIMQWSQEHSFVLSGNLHAGSLVASYPFDGSANMTAYYSASPDDATFKHLASVYSRAHRSMYLGRPECDFMTFPNGITNGNNWYPLQGGMQDWNYLVTGCMEITLELGCVKYPRGSEISTYWDDNKYSLIAFLSEVHRALRGFVFDGSTKLPIGKASIHVEGLSHLVNSTPYYGDYWRLLPPTGGVYRVWASKMGYFDSLKYEVNASLLPYVSITNSEQLNFTLWPDNQLIAEWSSQLDYNNTLNRLPLFIYDSTYDETIKNMFTNLSHSIKKYFTLHQITVSLGNTVNSTITTNNTNNDGRNSETLSTVYGIGLSLPHYSHIIPINDQNDNNNNTMKLQPQFDKIRIIILAGLNSKELISTEIAIRLLRHLHSGLTASSPDIWRLLATSQLLIFPYLDPVGIHESLLSVKQKQNLMNRSQNTHKLSSDNVDDHSNPIFDNENFQKITREFQPHLIITLESNNSTKCSIRNTTNINNIQRNQQLPLTAIHIPRDLNKEISNIDLFHNLAIGFISTVKCSAEHSFHCTKAPQNMDSISSSEKRLLDLFTSPFLSSSSLSASYVSSHSSPVTSSDNDRISEINSNHNEPFILRLGTGCHPQHLLNGSYLDAQQLPELWHSTLIGLNNLFSSVRNLSFCGQILIESGPLTSDLVTRLIEHRHWVPVPSSQIILQPAMHFFQQSNKSNSDGSNSSSKWLSVKINSSTGRFCELIPPGTYLMFAAAGPENSTFDVAYEQVAMALSFHVDRFNGRSHIHLKRELNEINFNGPDDIYDHMRNHTAESCGKMFSIGHSHLGRPIYAFEIGPKYTTLEFNADSLKTSTTTNLNTMMDSEFLFDVINDTYLSNNSMKYIPKIAVIGNLHGHDRLTPQLLVHFLDFLCDNRNSQLAVHSLLNSAIITIIPIPNPDGLYKAWKDYSMLSLPTWETREELSFDRDYCHHAESSFRSGSKLFTGYTNEAGIDLWEQLISLTGSNLTFSHHWWWESKSKLEFVNKSLQPENLALVKWLQLYQANSIISFPTDQLSDINYETDPAESSYGRDLLSESYNWLRFLGKLLSPSLHRPSAMCTLIHSISSETFSKISDRRRRPSDFRIQYVNPQKFTNKFAKSAALSLGLASMNPKLALEETEHFQLQSSLSFPPPLPIMIPPSIGLTLCPGCFSPSPSGVARIWTDYRFPSLMAGLIQHTSLIGLGSLGLIGHVRDSNNQPIPWVRIHLDYVRSELSTGSSDQNGHFSMILPPGMYHLTLRARGYLDLSEIIHVDVLKSPIYHVFYMKHVGGLSPTYRLYVVSMTASIIALFSCGLTIYLCYRFCCYARTPYAIERRSAGKSNNKTSLSSNNQIKRGPYSLLALDDDIHHVSSDNNSDNYLESMLKHRSDEKYSAYEDSDDDNVNVMDKEELGNCEIVECDVDIHQASKITSLIKTKLFNKHNRRITNRLHSKSRKHIPNLLKSPNNNDAFEEVQLV